VWDDQQSSLSLYQYGWRKPISFIFLEGISLYLEAVKKVCDVHVLDISVKDPITIEAVVLKPIGRTESWL